MTIGVDAHAAVRVKKRLTVLVSTGLPIVVLLVGASVWIVAGRALRPLELAAAGADEAILVLRPIDERSVRAVGALLR